MADLNQLLPPALAPEPAPAEAPLPADGVLLLDWLANGEGLLFAPFAVVPFPLRCIVDSKDGSDRELSEFRKGGAQAGPLQLRKRPIVIFCYLQCDYDPKPKN